jgi:hypothetical protein
MRAIVLVGFGVFVLACQGRELPSVPPKRRVSYANGRFAPPEWNIECRPGPLLAEAIARHELTLKFHVQLNATGSVEHANLLSAEPRGMLTEQAIDDAQHCLKGGTFTGPPYTPGPAIVVVTLTLKRWPD